MCGAQRFRHCRTLLMPGQGQKYKAGLIDSKATLSLESLTPSLAFAGFGSLNGGTLRGCPNFPPSPAYRGIVPPSASRGGDKAPILPLPLCLDFGLRVRISKCSVSCSEAGIGTSRAGLAAEGVCCNSGSYRCPVASPPFNGDAGPPKTGYVRMCAVGCCGASLVWPLIALLSWRQASFCRAGVGDRGDGAAFSRTGCGVHVSCVFVSLSLSPSLPLWVSVCVPLCLCLSNGLCLSVFIFLLVSVCLCLSLSVFVRL